MAGRGHGHRLFRGIIWQAEDDEIGVVQCFALGGGVFALVIIERYKRKLRASRKPVGDFEASGAHCPVDEDRFGQNATRLRANIASSCSANRAAASARGSTLTAIALPLA